MENNLLCLWLLHPTPTTLTGCAASLFLFHSSIYSPNNNAILGSKKTKQNKKLFLSTLFLSLSFPSMADLKSTFLNVYSVLKSELLHDPAFEWSEDSRQWVDRVFFLSSLLSFFIIGIIQLSNFKYLNFLFF
jgi:hypothetical protein